MNTLQDILRAEIARDGAIPFARFMELSLYCPNFGYYERTDVSPGRKGDFYTSVSVGELFGELLANQFAEWTEGSAECGVRSAESGKELPKRAETSRSRRREEADSQSEISNLKPEITGSSAHVGGHAKWQIVEAGAHDGRLAADILRWMKAERQGLVENLEYWLIEPSARRRLMQEQTLAAFAGKVRWFESWADVPESGVHGIIFSNELLDAMPVHRIGWDAAKKEWFEWGVTGAENHFQWIRLAKLSHSAVRTPHSALTTLPPELLDVLPDGFTTEVCPAAIAWWRSAARALKSGKLMTIDYGLRAEQFFTPTRKDGTLRAYYQHHQSNDLLARPGEQDLTAQVNFTAIQSAGEAEGLKTEIFSTQRQFLTHIIEKNCCHNPTVKEWTSSRVRQFQTLTHPEHLGQSFQVLVQSR